MQMRNIRLRAQCTSAYLASSATWATSTNSDYSVADCRFQTQVKRQAITGRFRHGHCLSRAGGCP